MAAEQRSHPCFNQRPRQSSSPQACPPSTACAAAGAFQGPCRQASSPSGLRRHGNFAFTTLRQLGIQAGIARTPRLPYPRFLVGSHLHHRFYATITPSSSPPPAAAVFTADRPGCQNRGAQSPVEARITPACEVTQFRGRVSDAMYVHAIYRRFLSGHPARVSAWLLDSTACNGVYRGVSASRFRSACRRHPEVGLERAKKRWGFVIAVHNCPRSSP